MDTKRFALVTLAGFAALFVLGYLIWGLAFSDFFANNAGAATGVAKDPPDFLWLVLGQVAFAALLTLIVGSWVGASTAGAGLRAGAIVGILMGLGTDLVLYATTNMFNLTAALVDPVLVAIQVAVAGAVIGMVVGKTKAGG